MANLTITRKHITDILQAMDISLDEDIDVDIVCNKSMQELEVRVCRTGSNEVELTIIPYDY